MYQRVCYCIVTATPQVRYPDLRPKWGENGTVSEGVCRTVDRLSALFHASEEADIQVFHPRLFSTAPNAGPVVWAIDGLKLPNYLLPRDCPGVTFGSSATTTDENRDRFGVGEGRVVVIEAGWLRRVCECRLHIYELHPAGFRLFDEIAGYWLSADSVTPRRVFTLTDLPNAIVERGGELRVVHRLWPVRDAVAKSTLAFSMIRMRNALR